MKSVNGLFDLRGKKVLRLGLLLVSTLLIMGGSLFFYDRLVYERALSVSGVITSSGSSTQTVLNATPATILILAVSAILISLSVFGFLREMFRGRAKNQALVKELLSTIRVSLPEQTGPSIQLPSVQKDWEEAPEKETEKS